MKKSGVIKRLHNHSEGLQIKKSSVIRRLHRNALPQSVIHKKPQMKCTPAHSTWSKSSSSSLSEFS